MSRVKTDERIESDYNGSRRRQGAFISCKSKTGNKKAKRKQRCKK